MPLSEDFSQKLLCISSVLLSLASSSLLSASDKKTPNTKTADCYQEIVDAAYNQNVAAEEEYLRVERAQIKRLHLSAFTGNTDLLIKTLSELSPSGNYINHIDLEDGLTVLERASRLGYAQYVQIAILSGARIKGNPSTATTPLYLATIGDHEECVKTLLLSGAKADSELPPETPFELAKKRKKPEILELYRLHKEGLLLSKKEKTKKLKEEEEEEDHKKKLQELKAIAAAKKAALEAQKKRDKARKELKKKEKALEEALKEEQRKSYQTNIRKDFLAAQNMIQFELKELYIIKQHARFLKYMNMSPSSLKKISSLAPDKIAPHKNPQDYCADELDRLEKTTEVKLLKAVSTDSLEKIIQKKIFEDYVRKFFFAHRDSSAYLSKMITTIDPSIALSGGVPITDFVIKERGIFLQTKNGYSHSGRLGPVTLETFIQTTEEGHIEFHLHITAYYQREKRVIHSSFSLAKLFSAEGFIEEETSSERNSLGCDVNAQETKDTNSGDRTQKRALREAQERRDKKTREKALKKNNRLRQEKIADEKSEEKFAAETAAYEASLTRLSLLNFIPRELMMKKKDAFLVQLSESMEEGNKLALKNIFRSMLGTPLAKSIDLIADDGTTVSCRHLSKGVIGKSSGKASLFWEYDGNSWRILAVGVHTDEAKGGPTSYRMTWINKDAGLTSLNYHTPAK